MTSNARSSGSTESRDSVDESKHPLVVYAQRKGSNPRSVRDAAHEAHHALVAGVEDWDRENIHGALMCKFPDWPSRIDEEILARAVEQLVCKALEVSCWSIEKAVHVMTAEHAVLYGVLMPSGIDRYIKRAMDAKRGRDAAARVLALIIPTPVRAPRNAVSRAKGKKGIR